MTRYSPTDRLGVNEVERIFLELGWIPRHILQTDVGIDMTVEVCQSNNPIGKFLGVQIKSGISYFSEQTKNSIIYRADKTHIDYWLNNALPIIIVLHNPSTNLTVWQTINEETIVNTGKNFKIEIPISKNLTTGSKDALERLMNGSPLLSKFKKLIMDKPIIDMLNNGSKVVIDLECWVNKSSGRADIKVYKVSQDEDFDEGTEMEQVLLQEFSVLGVHGYQSLYFIYPYANFSTDEIFYENFDDYDEDEMPGYKIVFIEDRFHNYELPIIPYSNNGETSSYRLVMSLNDYGRSFIDFYDYASGNKQLELNF
ncbi:MAG: DUF4365 domain-containing protein [Rivularia sp. (in: Bacteria)]|nr:DUF4365 domain-containing protein [Rivularia sp. MS3]MBV6643620.1 DUF4365 domain-containing protein [Cyclobacteriaceae bacterium SS2]